MNRFKQIIYEVKEQKNITREHFQILMETTSESEVELDSLGSFFMHLIDNDHYQDEAEASHADEVTILSSDYDPAPIPRIRRAIRKVKFSCPLSYLDPHFLLRDNCIFTPSWFLPTGFALTFRACSVLPLLFPSRSLECPLTV